MPIAPNTARFIAPHFTIRPTSSRPKCNHLETYGMSCDEADALWTRAQNCCEICGIPATETPGALYIDHDAYTGWNAVRGVLCNRCNKRLDDPREWPWPREYAYSAAHYLLNPWYLRPGSTTTVQRRKPRLRDFTFGCTHGERIVHSLSGWRYGDNKADCGAQLMYPLETDEIEGYRRCEKCAPARRERERAYELWLAENP